MTITPSKQRVAFFAICNAKHFVALAAMLSSLREVGHREPVYVTDCGLTDTQRAILESVKDVHLIDLPGDAAATHAPHVAHRLHGPRSIPNIDLAVLVDADIIWRRTIHTLYGAKPVFFNNDQQDRFHPDWKMLGYPSIEQRPGYMNAGLAILTPNLIAPFQTGIERMLELATTDKHLFATPEDPFYWVEQDVLNAMIASLHPDTYLSRNAVAFWPFKKGPRDPIVLHHIQPKPWIVPRPQNIYTREMIRLLYEGEVALPESEIPTRFRRDRRGMIQRHWYTLRYHTEKHVRGKLGIRRRFGKTGSRHFNAG